MAQMYQKQFGLQPKSKDFIHAPKRPSIVIVHNKWI
jgi:hypothetical protein